jgi:hypothetical protein
MDAPELLNLLNIGKGSTLEIFDHNLQKVIENIADSNTDPEATRAVTLKITFKPFKDRSGAETKVDARVTLAPVKAVESSIFLSRTNGEVRAYPRDMRQQVLFTAPETPANVVPMTAGTEGHKQ